MSQYACTAVVPGTTRRCEAWADGSGRCEKHPSNPRAPEPDVVLAKFFINVTQSQHLEECGIRRVAVDRVDQEEQHIAAARKVGVDPYRHREVADVGTRVFGENGLTAAQVFSIQSEMGLSGYGVLDVHLIAQRSKKGDILTVIFVRENLAMQKGVSSHLLGFTEPSWGSTWKFVHVWANPLGRDGYLVENLRDKVNIPEDGLIVHTVNCVGRMDGKPSTSLKFREGLWGVS